jgi:flagellar motor protein MotB
MSDKSGKPVDPDPDATVTFQRSDLKKPDDDATVMMPSRKALEKPVDDDATVMLSAKSLQEPPKEVDADATVTLRASDLRRNEEAAAETAAAIASPATPPAAFRTDNDPEVTAAGVQPPSLGVTTEPSRLPMIGGAIVVVAVILYFVFSGNKAPAPAAPQAQAPASVPAASAPPAAASPAAPPAAPAAQAPAPTPAAPPAASKPASSSPASSKLADVLAADIKRGAIAVTEQGGVSTITLQSTHQFASGGVDPEASVRPLLLGLAAALDKVPGAIVVTGHADAKPSSHPKFPTNEALSAARGASAARLMAGKLKDPKRISSEGASDKQQLAPSDTPENRAKNRRLVITVKP